MVQSHSMLSISSALNISDEVKGLLLNVRHIGTRSSTAKVFLSMPYMFVYLSIIFFFS